MSRTDYGAPLRVWRLPGPPVQFTILPPRSQDAYERYRTRGNLIAGAFIARGQLQGCSERAGPHLGVRAHWSELPAYVQQLARDSFLGRYCPPPDRSTEP